MERTQSKAKQGKRGKASKKGEIYPEDIRGGRSSRRDRSQGRRRPTSLSRQDAEDKQCKKLEVSKKAKPSFASFSLHQDLLCDEPEEQTEVQTDHIETIQDTSQEMKKLKNMKSDEIKDLKSQLHTVSERLKAQLLDMEEAELESRTKAEQLEADLLLERAQVQKLKEKLAKTERDAEKTRASHQRQIEGQREENKKIASALKRAEDLLDSERLCWQQEKTSLLEEMEKSRALFEDQLDEQKHENKTLVAALKDVEQKLENHRVEWQEEKISLIQATEEFKKRLQDTQQEAKEAMERYQASHQAQLEEHREETRKIASALKNAQGLLESESLSWLQVKTSMLEEKEKSRALHEAQLDEQKRENKTLAAAFKNVEQKLDSHLVRWHEEKTSLIQATEGLKKTLQEKEQEWQEMESSMKSQLEDLMTKKKKKKKWYRRFI